MSLADSISDAEGNMQHYLTDEFWSRDYEWNRPRIDALLREMRRVRLMLDVRGTSRECLWPHVLPIRDILEKERLTKSDHKELSRMIDALPGQ